MPRGRPLARNCASAATATAGHHHGITAAKRLGLGRRKGRGHPSPCRASACRRTGSWPARAGSRPTDAV